MICSSLGQLYLRFLLSLTLLIRFLCCLRGLYLGDWIRHHWGSIKDSLFHSLQLFMKVSSYQTLIFKRFFLLFMRNLNFR